jgi:hypothetical protein
MCFFGGRNDADADSQEHPQAAPNRSVIVSFMKVYAFLLKAGAIRRPRLNTCSEDWSSIMKIKTTMCYFAGGGAMSLALLAALPAVAYNGQKLEKDAKISMSEARAIALKAHPGKITDEELERERSGSGLRYSFDIKSGGVTYEVGVDAKTGKVLENAKEGPHPD